ncbi:MAG: heme o synthase [Geminicoccaceae bacterium]
METPGTQAVANAQAGLAVQSSSVRDYWHLMKPNVMRLVVFSAWAGMFLAPGSLHPLLFVTAVLAITVAAGAAAAINNAYDADIDQIMRRTAWRPTAKGRISPADALGFGLTLSIFAVMVMGLALNWVAAALLALTIAFYVIVYTMWLKRRTPQNIVIGGAAGAFPPMVGWAAVSGDVTLASVVLFLIIFMWTPPHFWALSLYRKSDYANARVPMLPVVAGEAATRLHVFAYTLVLTPVTLLPQLVGMASVLYTLFALGLGARFIYLAWQLYRAPSTDLAKATFRYSLWYLFAIFTALVLDKALMTWLWSGAWN